MSLKLDSRYIRTSPKGDESIVIIKTQEELSYHEDLLKNNYKYKEVVPTSVPGATCVSCEG